MADYIDRALREYRRYSSDGLPNPPSADAPVGDPASGVHNPTKADLRELLRFVIDQFSPFDGEGFIEDIEQSILTRAPEIFAQVGDPLGVPADNPYFNLSIGHGANPANAGEIWRSTFLGTMAGAALESSERVEAIGSGAMRFARWAERSTAVGSLALQWLGAQPPELASI
jgi:hypothetical protein